jgi:hypothetical protein
MLSLQMMNITMNRSIYIAYYFRKSPTLKSLRLDGDCETWIPILLYEIMRNKNMSQDFILWLITTMTDSDFFEHLADFVFVAVITFLFSLTTELIYIRYKKGIENLQYFWWTI